MVPGSDRRLLVDCLGIATIAGVWRSEDPRLLVASAQTRLSPGGRQRSRRPPDTTEQRQNRPLSAAAPSSPALVRPSLDPINEHPWAQTAVALSAVLSCASDGSLTCADPGSWMAISHQSCRELNAPIWRCNLLGEQHQVNSAVELEISCESAAPVPGGSGYAI